ncbi:MAG: sigma-54-dependent Fis family transcriptional regulator [Desulfobulbus sp.]|nr:MAG: sigma-54-dependent Fis family transcriptional regulator [Desulfobulbus sp.]
MKKSGRVVLVDNDPHVCRAAGQTLQLAGFETLSFQDAVAALEVITPDWPGVIVTDVRMDPLDGFQLLEQVMARDTDLPVIMITGHGEVSMAVDAMRKGAYDFIEKPLSTTHLIDVVSRAQEKRKLVLDNRALRARIDEKEELESIIIGRSVSIAQLRRTILNIADTDTDVLIQGETGTGKELVSRCLHEQSRRCNKQFVAINCGAIAETIIENELFGHDPGAFTGADKVYIGKFEQADGGTLFLDEIESMPNTLQVRLLRVLQERSIERLGGSRVIPLDLRIVAASKKNLKQACEEGIFREDLYYRLNVAKIEIPPLRKRVDDIPLLFSLFLERAAKRLNRPVPDITTIILHQLMQRRWSGNVRELENVAERHVLGLEESCSIGLDESSSNIKDLALVDRINAFEKCLIMRELERQDGSITATYKSLGLPRKTLYYKMKKHGLLKIEEQ